MNTKNKKYTLSDGSMVSIDQIVEATGITPVGAYSRLRRSSKPEYIFAPVSMDSKPLLSRIKAWINLPDEVIAGIQFKASWEDGKLNGIRGPSYDRDGLVMSKKEVEALALYREELRQQWLNDNNIINKEVKDD